MNKNTKQSGGFIPKAWEGTENLPPELWSVTRVLKLALAFGFVTGALALIYFTFTTELGLDIMERILKGVIIGLAVWAAVAR